jgi:hypothetical protein
MIQSVSLTTSVDNVTANFGAGPLMFSHDNRTISFSNVGGKLLSDQKFVLIPEGELEASLSDSYVPLGVNTLQSKWWNINQKGVDVDIQLAFLGGCSSSAGRSIKERPDALVMKSLDMSGTERSVKKWIVPPLKAMKYSILPDYNAAKTNVLDNYVKGRQIWYLLCHGGNTRIGDEKFFQLELLNKEMVTALDLEPLDLDYRLVVMDACYSAQTSDISEEDSRERDTLLPHTARMADAFGAHAAYMGWSWWMTGGAPEWSGKFLSYLQYDSELGRARTVQEARDKFIEVMYHPKTCRAAKNMKVYGATDNIIDDRKGVNGQ